MSQSSAIAGALVIAFVVFITIRGQLPCYLQVLGVSNAGGASCPSNVGGAGSGVTIGTGGISAGRVGVSIPIPGTGGTIGIGTGGITLGGGF